MKSVASTLTSEEVIAQLKAEIARMAENLSVLQQQVDWFKRQLFGRKSEKQIIDNPHQPLLDGFQIDNKTVVPAPETVVKAHQRQSPRKGSDDAINETGLRFDASVPQKIITLPAA